MNFNKSWRHTSRRDTGAFSVIYCLFFHSSVNAQIRIPKTLFHNLIFLLIYISLNAALSSPSYIIAAVFQLYWLCLVRRNIKRVVMMRIQFSGEKIVKWIEVVVGEATSCEQREEDVAVLNWIMYSGIWRNAEVEFSEYSTISTSSLLYSMHEEEISKIDHILTSCRLNSFIKNSSPRQIDLLLGNFPIYISAFLYS